VVIGPFINAGAVLLGGVLGAVLSQRLPERIRSSMPSIFGLIGEFCYLEKGINGAVSRAKNLLSRGQHKGGAHDSYIPNYVAIIILFCASGTGIFGSMQEGMTGDPSILIAKAFLDFFTATIFATTLGIAVAAICVPMLLIQLALATCATLILPLTTPAMMADFTAVGGLLLLATGLRICGIKMFAVVNMLPALMIAMPLSALWTAFFA